MIRKLFTFFLFSLIALCTVNAQGQRKNMSKEDFRNRQQKYFMEKSGITDEEATKFFPLYYELQDKKSEINKNVWKKAKDAKNNKLSEEECSEVLQKMAEAKLASDKLDLEYIPKFKNVISSKKLLKLQIAEMMFHRDMLKVMHQQPPRPNNPK